ncbi:ATP phosphoribosyltransferase regulatory subunit [Rhodospirillaceae bacterium SYSU D60014]|uniref:ATP phosphoribosyltransferase regulatory subunit n=1 Tax=Virgifigura deserti TaxID=2268457 RepID=UPI000E66264A
MKEFGEMALLPAGLRDILPPDAAFEARVVERLLAGFTAQGYAQVKPPLIEFEESLLSGAGAAMTAHTFRLMDPVSQRMMGLRADITPQVARIAATRLQNAPRPLRLCYAGQTLRIKGSQLRPERQVGQAGVELIGGASAGADAEVVLVAAEALQAVGVPNLTVDLTLPTLVPALASGLGFADATVRSLVATLDRKDAPAIQAIAGGHAPRFVALMRAAGPARRAMAALQALDLPATAAAERAHLGEVVDLILTAAPDLNLTIDPVEHRGFEYHTGVSFTLFARRVRGELGRGGRYLSGDSESSTGFTLYMDTLLRALPQPIAARRVFVPAGTPRATAARLREEGWVTVAGLDRLADPRREARRQACSHALVDGEIQAVGGTKKEERP